MAKIAAQRASQADVDRVPGAKGIGENPPVITKEAGQKAEPKGRATGSKGNTSYNTSSSAAHDGVMGKRGGTQT